MKVAELAPVAVDVMCPYCNETTEKENPNTGSLMWEVHEMTKGKVCNCSECGKAFRFPARIRSMALDVIIATH